MDRSFVQLTFFLLFFTQILSNEAYRILAVFPFEAKSHFFFFEALCKSLAEDGHRVDVISFFPQKNPVENYTDVLDLSGKRSRNVSTTTVKYATSTKIDATLIAERFGNRVCEVLGHEDVSHFLGKARVRNTYDAVITEVRARNTFSSMTKSLYLKFSSFEVISKFYVW